MNVGTMEIMGTINVENIKTGITQMKKSFSDIKMEDISPSVNLDNLKTSFTEINTQSISLADNMNRIGTSASFENINTGLDLTKYSLGGVQTQTKSLAESMKKLGGSVYTEGVTRGLTQMKNSLSSAKVQAKSLFGDMSRLGKTVTGMGKTMAVAGVGFLASLTAIASVGPQTSVAVERMKFEMFRLGMALDNVLGPAFNNAVDYVGEFVDYLGGDGKWMLDIFGEVVSGVGAGVVEFAGDVKGAVEWMGKLAKNWAGKFGFDLEITAVGDLAQRLTPDLLLAMLGKYLGGAKLGGPLAIGLVGTYESYKVGTTGGKWMAEHAPDWLSNINTMLWEKLGFSNRPKEENIPSNITQSGNSLEEQEYKFGIGSENNTVSEMNKGIWEIVDKMDNKNLSGNMASN